MKDTMAETWLLTGALHQAG